MHNSYLVFMEIRHKVALTSSWDVSGSILSVLYIRNRSTGIVLDEPPSSERPSSTPLMLTAINDQPCYIYVDLSGLCGYLPSSLELVSESRTAELYDGCGDEYLATARGAPAKDPNDDTSLYNCEFSLPSDIVLNKITLKLLSLKGRTQVSVSKLILDVSEDHNGPKEDTLSKSSQNLSQHQQFLSSLDSQSLPPFLKQLVTSLQSVSTKEEGTGGPPNLSMLSSAFRQVHSALSLPTAEPKSPAQSSVSKETAEKVEISAPPTDTTSSAILAPAEQTLLLNRLEEKLMHYIDAKFAELESKIDARLEKIFSNHLKGGDVVKACHPVNGHDSEEDTIQCHGSVEESLQLD